MLNSTDSVIVSWSLDERHVVLIGQQHGEKMDILNALQDKDADDFLEQLKKYIPK